MSAVEYLPGDRWLISGPTAALHLAGETAAALRWWPRIRDGVTARELVTLLHDEGVLRSATPFAMIAVEAGAVRVIVGGDTVVMVEDAAGQQLSITGADLLTWNEQLVPDAAVVYVNCETLPAAGEMLPMPAGVVRADALRWALEADGPAVRSSQPQRSDSLPPGTVPLDTVPLETGPLPEDPLDHLRVEDVLVDVPAVEVPGSEVPGGEMPADRQRATQEVSGQDSAHQESAHQDVVADEIVGDDAVTLIGVVPSTLLAPTPTEDVDTSLTVVHPDSESGEGSEARADLESAEDTETGEHLDSEEDPESGQLSETEPNSSMELPGEVTQTVPPEDLEHGDRVAPEPDPDPNGRADIDDGADIDVGADIDGRADLDDRADAEHDVSNEKSSSENGAGAAVGGAAVGTAGPAVLPDSSADALSDNPFPRMRLPPFVPPSAPGFITSATPSGPQQPPFAPPPAVAGPGIGRTPGEGPVGASTIRDVPRPSAPPPFVPAATTLPPISSVPAQLAQISSAAPDPGDQDAVATGLPPTTDAADPLLEDRVAESRAGDHDGHTVLAESLPADHRPPAMPPEPGPGQVYASLCPAGHPNAPYAGDCRICGTPIPATEPVLVARPTMAVLRMSSGAVIELDRRVIVGRAPSVSRVASADVPHLVTVASPHGDVSRSHVEVRVDDWHIVVTDLNSTNGTEVHAAGRAVQLLRAGAGVVVEIGWQIDLGDGAGFLVDHL